MYYSKNHEGLVFIDRGVGELEFSGKGIIRPEDTEIWNPVENWQEPFTAVTVQDAITEIHAGVLDRFSGMKKLCLPKSLRCIEMLFSKQYSPLSNSLLGNQKFKNFG